MTIEEKARAYDEAVNKIKPLYEQAKRDGNPIWSTYEYFIPELRESEDERIRKEIINYLDFAESHNLLRAADYEKKKRWIAYLEKQKESLHIPETYKENADSFADISEDERTRKQLINICNEWLGGGHNARPCLNDIRWLKNLLENQEEHKPISAEEVLARAGLKPYKDGNQWCILAGDNILEGICGFGNTIDEALYQFLMEVLEKQKEQKPAVSEHDAYELLSKKGYVVIEREVYNELCEKAEQKPDNKCKGCNNVKGCINCVDGSEWAHIEEIEQNPAWSEEDEEALREVKLNFELNHDDMTPTLVGFYERFFNKLKSLRPQPHWKPSEEQMKHLERCFSHGHTSQLPNQHVLESLYNELKKLM